MDDERDDDDNDELASVKRGGTETDWFVLDWSQKHADNEYSSTNLDTQEVYSSYKLLDWHSSSWARYQLQMSIVQLQRPVLSATSDTTRHSIL